MMMTMMMNRMCWTVLVVGLRAFFLMTPSASNSIGLSSKKIASLWVSVMVVS